MGHANIFLSGLTEAIFYLIWIKLWVRKNIAAFAAGFQWYIMNQNIQKVFERLRQGSSYNKRSVDWSNATQYHLVALLQTQTKDLMLYSGPLHPL